MKSYCLLLSITVLGLLLSPLANAEKIKITDSHGKWSFDEPPKRIAVINWTLSEQILELGVVPVAMADVAGFKKTAPQTKVDASIIDLGSRFTPSLTKLSELKPDLIIIGYSQRDLLRPLSNIASVMYFNNFSRRFENTKKADERFLVLAKLFGRTEYATHKLADRDAGISDIKLALNEHFKGDQPQVTIASLKEDSAWLFLNNSIPYSVASDLGFKPSPIEKEPSKLGAHKISLKDLSSLEGCIVFLNSDSKLSKQSPESIVVKNPQCRKTLNTTHAYGGSLSKLYLAQTIAQAFDAL